MGVLKIILKIVVALLGLWALVIFANLYSFTVTYPGAGWTDDGKQVVFLEYREISKVDRYPMWSISSRILKQKTYLRIMNPDGSKRKTIAEVPGRTDQTVWNFHTSENKVYFASDGYDYEYDLDRRKWGAQKSSAPYEYDYDRKYPWNKMKTMQIANHGNEFEIYKRDFNSVNKEIRVTPWNDPNVKTLFSITQTESKSYLIILPWWRV